MGHGKYTSETRNTRSIRNQPDVADKVSHRFQSARISIHGSGGDGTTLEFLATAKRTRCETTRRTPKDDVCMNAKRRSTFLDGLAKGQLLKRFLRTPRKHLTTLLDVCTDDKTPDVTQSVLIQDEFCT